MDPQLQHLRNLFAKHFATALSKVEHNRGYALDDRAKAEGTSLALAYRDEILANSGRFDTDELAKIVDELAAILPGLKQNRPPPEPDEPKAWRDPITGEYCLNPFKKETLDLESQATVEKNDPVLAKRLKAIAERGLSYALLQREKDEREAREKIRDLPYAAREHTPERNPFLLPPSAAARQAQAEFVRQHEKEPHLIEWYKKEAATPVSLSFDNLTTRQQIARRNPVVGKIYERARELHAYFLREEKERLQREVEERQQQLQATQRQLATAK